MTQTSPSTSPQPNGLKAIAIEIDEATVIYTGFISTALSQIASNCLSGAALR